MKTQVCVNILIAGISLFAMAIPAKAAGLLPDGTYTCSTFIGGSLAILGDVQIKGSAYRGPSFAPSGPFHPFRVGGDGQITWSGGFGALTQDGSVVTSSVIIPNAKPTFRVNYTLRGSGDTTDCTRE